MWNVFSDPQLRTRQDLLDAQWKALNGLVNTCDNLASQSWVEFVNDFKAWQVFYDSGSDWTSNSKHATDEYQYKAQDWAQRLTAAGCSGTIGSENGRDISSPTSGIPGVGDPPPDAPGWLDEGLDAIGKVQDKVTAPFATAGWVAVGVVVLVVVAIVVITTKGHISGYGVTAGGA